MRTATGRLDRVLVLGGDSDIGVATTTRLVADRGATSVVLAGRDPAALEQRAPELGGADVEVVAWDARATDRHGEVLGAVFDRGDVDVVVLAVGLLGDQAEVEADTQALVRLLDTNFTGCAAALSVVADRLAAQGHGTAVVLSTIAATQARRANHAYGASKAGLDAFALGTGDRLAGTGAHVLVVRPGFVRSSMTAGMQEAPFSVDVSDVAVAIVAALDRPGRAVVYVPPAVRFISWLLRVLPRALLRRLPR